LRTGRRPDVTGYYADTFQDETYSPRVFQITGRRRGARYVPAYMESVSDGYVIDLDEVFQGSPYSQLGTDSRDSDAALDAARAADGLAERAAEREREYREAWQAGALWTDLGEEVRHARRAALALIRQSKASRDKLYDLPAVRDAICATLKGYLAAMRNARKQRDELTESFIQWNRSAFNEGAGSEVFS